MSDVFAPSLARQGLDLLLFMHKHLDLVSIDWQVPSNVHDFGGPWLLVELGQPSDDFDEQRPAWAIWRYAIWKTTGAVHRIGHDGAVDDDPIAEPNR